MKSSDELGNNQERLASDLHILDADTALTLKDHFASLSKQTTLVVSGKSHPKYSELVELLTDVASCSLNISVKEEQVSDGYKETHGLGFNVFVDERDTGIGFCGIPGGHEFSSLVLAILNSQHLGKMPDAFMARQIKSLKGPISLRTFVSLSCENCPAVVQTLNQLAVIHPNFRNDTIDGDLAPLEIERLKIGAVPAVFCGDQLLLSGKVTFVTLLEKLTSFFGKDEATDSSQLSKTVHDSTPASAQPVDLPSAHFDVLVVGGGPAGASAAIYSARKGLKTVLVAERMGGQVADTQGIENMISTTYTVGAKLVEDLNKHISTYPIVVKEHRRVETFVFGDNQSEGEIKNIAKLSSGEVLSFAKLIFATGAKWRELNVPGEKEYLGRGVAFCPHCDGPLYKDKTIAVIGGGNSGVEAALDLANLCKKITLIEFSSELKADHVLVTKLKKSPNIEVVTGAKTTEIFGDGTTVQGLRYMDQESGRVMSLPLDGVFVQIGLIPNSAPLKGLVKMNSFGEIIVDEKGRTSLPGVYAAGDVTTVPYKQIVISIGDGAKAALGAFEDKMLH